MSKSSVSMKVKPKRIPHRKRYFSGILIVLCWLLVCQFDLSAFAATYYLDAVNGNDSNPGTSKQPWKTLAKSQSTLVEGDTVKLRNGNYGAFTETIFQNRTNWIKYIAAEGNNPILTSIYIRPEYLAKSKNAYLEFDGIDIIIPITEPLPSDNDLPWNAPNCIHIRSLHHVTVKNATVSGNNKYLTRMGIVIDNSDYVSIIRCNINTIAGGLDATNCNDLTIYNNHIHNLSRLSGITLSGNTDNTLIEGNHIHGITYDYTDTYFPPDWIALKTHAYPEDHPPAFNIGEIIQRDTEKGILRAITWLGNPYNEYRLFIDMKLSEYGSGGFNTVSGDLIGQTTGTIVGSDDIRVIHEAHHTGSGIAMRISNVIIRNNIVHNHWVQGIYFYSDSGPYSNIIFENNLFYDCGKNWFHNIAGKLIMRNNTLIGAVSKDSLSTSSIASRYYDDCPLSIGFADSYNGSGFEAYNNIIVGAYPFPNPQEYVGNPAEDYNICWSNYIGIVSGYHTYSEQTYGNNSRMAVWRDYAGIHGYPNFFEDIAFYGTTEVYDFASDGIQPFFVNPGFYTSAQNPDLAQDRTRLLDYHLADSSPGINFGDPTKQPSDSLGTIGPDGFIRNDGPPRDATHHSAGCYEYTATEPDTTPPIITNIQSSPSNSEVVTWATDEPATSQVEYGLDTSYGSMTTLDTNLVTAHSVTITGLDPETTYHYRVCSKDAAGNEAVSGDYTFTTPPDASNQPPTADAGSDQLNVIDADWNGSEQVTLDGTQSADADGTIQSYQWHEGALLLATGVNPTVTLSVGDHTITLTVTDNDGLTDTDTVEISINYPVQHSINAFIVGEGGTIDPSGIIHVYEGGDHTFTITPAGGYEIADVQVNSVSQGAISSYTFNDIDEDHTISASFAEIAQTYTITATAGANGGISPGGSVQVNSGSDQAFAITADEGYQISDILVDGISQGAISSYTFNDVTKDHTISASFTEIIQIYTITTSASTGGNITPEGSVQINSGGEQTFMITAEEGYQISDVLVDDVSQGVISSYTFNNIDADHTISVNFALNAYTITASAGTGGMITPAGDIEVDQGANLPFSIEADQGYQVQEVTVDGVSQGEVTDYTFHNVTADHTISATFVQQTFTITTSAETGGSIEPSGAVQVNAGEDKTFSISPSEEYRISNVTIDGLSHGALETYTFNNVRQDYHITVYFTHIDQDNDDQIPPKVTNCTPRSEAIQVPLNSLIMLHVTDAETGVDPNTITIRVQDEVIYADGAAEYSSDAGHCHRVGSKNDYAFMYQPFDLFAVDQQVTVQVEVADYANNWLTSNNSYTFQTEMRSFGGNRTVDLDTRIPKDYPATVVDSQGNIYLTWQAGLEGSRNVFVSKLATGQTEFGTAVKVTSLASDQCRPAIAIDSQDKIHLVWQDKRRGNWDIYYRSSTDGVNWASEAPLIESDQDQANQTNPQIVIDSTNKAYVVFEDDRNGNSDIYGVSSTNGFVLKNWFSVTSNWADQTLPALVADAVGGVYAVWADRRNGSADIYGAGNLVGPWANIALVTGAAEQSEPAITGEESGSILHLVWVNESNGNRDIYYAATSGGFGGAPLTGVNLVDDSTGAVQIDPAIATVGRTGDDLKVYVAWQDERNVSTGSDDLDIYFTESSGEFGTNVLVTDGYSGAGQIHPAMGVGAGLEPYLVWVDYASGMVEIEYGGTTRICSAALAEKYIMASQGGYAGAHPDQINSVDDVCVEIPAGALWSDLNVMIHTIENPSALTSPGVQDIIARYEFGPSSAREFAKPVTITIPYAATESASETVYWYNPETDQLSQTGISSIELIVISDTLHAVRFQTTHFTQYVVAVESSSENGDGGGGGCSMSSYRVGPGGIVGFFLPYAVLIAVLWVLKIRDRQRQAT